MPVVYIENKTKKKMIGVLTQPNAGLNEYSEVMEVEEDYLSDALDVLSYRDNCMVIGTTKTLSSALSYFPSSANNDGIVYSAVAIPTEVAAKKGFVFLAFNKTDSKWYVKNAISSTGTITEYEVTSYGLPTASITNYKFDVSLFFTEAEQYACFVCSSVKKIIWYDVVGAKVGSVDLPFYPKRITTHTNRIVAIDSSNKLWWCRVGDFHSWYSMEYDDDALLTSTAVADGAYTLTGTMEISRPITITVDVVGDADTLGTVVLVGLDGNGEALTVTKTPIVGRVQTNEFFSSLTSATQAGHTAVGTADNITIGTAPVSGFVQNDAGYWTLENESELSDICVIGNKLYIFAPNNIYAFSGDGPDTFYLTLLVSSIGAVSGAYDLKTVVSTGNMAFFIFNSEVYEFNGSDQPMIIGRPVKINGSTANSINGGIPPLSDLYALSADANKLYVYRGTKKTVLAAGTDAEYYYSFDLISHVWWKLSSFSNNNSGPSTNFTQCLIPAHGRGTMFALLSYDTTEGYFNVYSVLGHKGIYTPFIVTKAYNNNPSDDGTLTDILLVIAGTATDNVAITVSYSITGRRTISDFSSLYTEAAHVLTGDIEIIRIPVSNAYVARAHHYRIKVGLEGLANSVYLYNIERRFRIVSRSR